MRLNQNLLIACSALLVGCTTSTNELEQDVTFSANVDRAMIEIDGVRVGRTPIRVALDRTRNHEIVVGKSGYETYQTVLRPTLNGGDYGFQENIKVNLSPDTGAPTDVPEEDMPAFNRAKSLADAPFGVDAAIYGTLAGDLAEARQSAERLAAAANTAKRRSEAAEQNLAKAVAALKAQEGSGDAEAAAKLEANERSLRNALADAEAAAKQLEKTRQVVDERLAFLESLQAKGQAAPKESTEAVAAAKLDAEAAQRKAEVANEAVAKAAAALEAAAAAKAKTAQAADPARIEAISRGAEANRANVTEFAAKIEQSSRSLAARVDELARQLAEGKASNPAAEAELAAARRENAELAVQLAAAKAAAAKGESEQADKALAEANEKAAALEAKLADTKLAVEAKTREVRARTYAEYTARKGLLERGLRTGELNKETYQQALEALDKELRNR